MLPLAENSEALLTAIWQVTALLALGSVLVLLLLIAHRFFSERRARREKKIRKDLSRYFYAALSSPVEIQGNALPLVNKNDMDVLCHIALDILRTVKGSDSRRILKLLEAWHIRPYLLSVLEKGTRGEKIQALTLLALYGEKENLDIILEHARSGDTYVQLASLRGIATQYGTQHIDTIIDILSRTQNTNRLMLADILQHFGPDAAPFLSRLAREAGHIDVRVASLMALGMIRPLSATAEILPLLEDSHEDIRAKTAIALGRIGDMSAGPFLIKALADESVEVRIQAAQALGKIKDEAALSVLADCLGDENWWVGFHAAEALFHMGDNGKSLLRSLSSRQDAAGIMSAQVLAEMTGV